MYTFYFDIISDNRKIRVLIYFLHPDPLNIKLYHSWLSFMFFLKCLRIMRHEASLLLYTFSMFLPVNKCIFKISTVNSYRNETINTDIQYYIIRAAYSDVTSCPNDTIFSKTKTKPKIIRFIPL